MDKIVQYVVVRSDLGGVLKWPLGAVIAQCCHATTAIAHLFCNDPVTQTYFADLNNMHKVVLKVCRCRYLYKNNLILKIYTQVDNEEELLQLSQTLNEADIKHKMWIEQPEEIPTCIALKPYKKQDVQKYLRKYKMY